MKSTLLAKTISEKGYGLLAEKILFLNQKRLKDRCHAEMASITAQVSFLNPQKINWLIKVGRVFPMVILSDFRMGQHRDDDRQEDASHFNWPSFGA